MATLTVRNLDDDVIDRLRLRAAENDRSVEAEVRALIRRAVGAGDRAAFIEASRRIARMSPMVDPPITTDLLREDRDSH